MIVFGGSSSIKLAEEVSKTLNCRFGRATFKRFPDGEKFVKIDTSVDHEEEVVVVQSTNHPQDENLMELFFMMDALSDLGGRVTAVVPYFGYGRQDRAFEKGEAVSSRTIAKHIGVSAERFVTVNPHKDYILDYFDVPATAVDASSEIGNFFRREGLENPLVVAPDLGSKALAQKVADALDCVWESCEKKRLAPGKVVTSADNVALSGNDILIVDDIIDSGGTIVEAVKALKRKGAGSVRVACVHAVLTGNASQKILDVADQLVATDTIQTEFSAISIAPLIVKEIMRRLKA